MRYVICLFLIGCSQTTDSVSEPTADIPIIDTGTVQAEDTTPVWPDPEPDSDTSVPHQMRSTVGCDYYSYSSISEAMENTDEDKIIFICQGEYFDNLVIDGRRLLLEGDMFVFIKPLDLQKPVITMTNGADVSLTNLDFNAATSGVIVMTDSTINIYDSVLTHNSAVTGSVIRMAGGSGGIYNSNVSFNTTTGQSRGAIEMIDSDVGPANLWMEKVFWNSGDPAWGSFDRNVDWDVLFTPQGEWPYGTRFTYLHNDASFLCTTDEAINPTEHPGFCLVPF